MGIIEILAEALRTARVKKGHSLSQAREIIGKKEETLSRWERGLTDLKVSDMESIAKYAGTTVKELICGKEKKPDGVFEIEIYTKEDRLNVAKILLDNGYAVSQGKRQKTPTGKQVIYYLRVSKDPNGISGDE